MTGLSIARMARIGRWNVPSTTSRSCASDIAGMSCKNRVSPPDENATPAPVTTTARTARWRPPPLPARR
jgi:hypothetical protein